MECSVDLHKELAQLHGRQDAMQASWSEAQALLLMAAALRADHLLQGWACMYVFAPACRCLLCCQTDLCWPKSLRVTGRSSVTCPQHKLSGWTISACGLCQPSMRPPIPSQEKQLTWRLVCLGRRGWGVCACRALLSRCAGGNCCGDRAPGRWQAALRGILRAPWRLLLVCRRGRLLVAT